MNIKLNNEVIQNMNFNLNENCKNESENFMFYNKNQAYNRIPPSQIPNFNQNVSYLQGNHNNPISSDKNFINNLTQPQPYSINMIQKQKITKPNEFPEDFPQNLSNIMQNPNQLKNQVNSNTGTGKNDMKFSIL